MNSKTRNILTGIGSILNIFPDRELFTITPPASPAELMARSWERVGQDINAAIQQYSFNAAHGDEKTAA